MNLDSGEGLRIRPHPHAQAVVPGTNARGCGRGKTGRRRKEAVLSALLVYLGSSCVGRCEGTGVTKD